MVLITVVPGGGCGVPTSPEAIHPGFRGSQSAVLHRYATDPAYASWLRRFYESNRNGGGFGAAPNRRDDSVNARIQALREQTDPERRLQARAGGARSMNGFTVSVSERNTPPLFGAGLVDEIPSEVLVATAGATAGGRTGASQPHQGRPDRAVRLEGQVPSLHEFVRGACANELGLEVPGHSQGASPLTPGNSASGLDMTEPECDDLVAYVRSLAAPVAIDPLGPQGTKDMRAGRRLFAQVNCTACHVPKLGDAQGIYSDLLLHRMGQTLSDAGSSYGASNPATGDGPTPHEWRTPPLWGYRDSAPYMHDGRAQNLEEAVALHDGQAKASAIQFFRLTPKERTQVEAFLKSLVAPIVPAAPGEGVAGETTAPGDKEARTAAETLVRERREEASARDEERFREAQCKRCAEKAAKRAWLQIPLAQSLEKMGKITGALAFYQEIAREASGTKEGRLAESRISELTKQMQESP